jgi:alpha-glucosidase
MFQLQMKNLLLTLVLTAQLPAQTIAQSTTTSFAPRFTVPASADFGFPILPSVEDPEAPDSQASCPGYLASNVQSIQNGFTADLSLAGEPCNVLGNDVESLTLSVVMQAKGRVNVNIQPTHLDASNSSHYTLPETYAPIPTASNGSAQIGTFNVTWSNEPSFSFTLTRASNGDEIFSTNGSKLIYEDQFIEFVTTMPDSYNAYGLGERIHQLRLGNNLTATSWAADAGTPLDYNIYGTHPVYLDTRYYQQTPQGTWNYSTSANANETYQSYTHAVYNRNAHGQEVLMNANNITWRLLGGSIDLYFFDGPTPQEAIQHYQKEATGFPAMQQYWAFGYHQCRWGYQNWSVVQDVVDNFKKYDIPLETIWNDIDYMLAYRDFINDPNTFGISEGQQFLAGLHANNQHYIPIVDSAIYIPNPDNATDAYEIYNRGNDSNVFLNNPDGSQYIGSVWPGYTVFPDWHTENATTWWTNEMVTWHGQIPFDGIWIDMSEVSSFCVGSCGTGNLSLNPVHPPFLLPGEPGNIDFGYPEGFNATNSTEFAAASSSSASQASAFSTPAAAATSTTYFRSTPTPGVRNVDHPPYAIKNVNGDLAVHAVAPNATHHDGVQEYDVHNLNGHQILNATYQALLSVFPGRRPLIIGRSTFASSGRWAGHWGGDNVSKWTDMYFSIPQALSMAIFGIPMFGPDTCGFASNSDEELCNRWMQLSAFFPFYRNHNTLAANSQEPYRWGSVIVASKKAMHIRYSLLPYIYTLFYYAHTQAHTVMRALAWEFPNDPSLASADRQFLLGPALMVTPVLNQGNTSVEGVFPGIGQGTRWYDWYNGTEITNVTAGANVTIDAPLGHIPLFVRGGYVLPKQAPGYTTTDSRKGAWSLLVALSQNGTAHGDLYLDDGYSVTPNATTIVKFSVSGGTLSTQVSGNFTDSNSLANVTVWGLSSQPSGVKFNGNDLPSGNVIWNSTTLGLKVVGLSNVTSVSSAWSGNWTLSWT